MRGIEAKGQVNDRTLFFKQWNFTTVLLKMYHVHFWCISAVTFENYFVSKQTCNSNAGVHLCLPLENSVILACETVVIIIWFVFYIWKWIHLNFSAVSFTVCLHCNSVVLFLLSSLKALLWHEYISIFGDLKQYGLCKQNILAL